MILIENGKYFYIYDEWCRARRHVHNYLLTILPYVPPWKPMYFWAPVNPRKRASVMRWRDWAVPWNPLSPNATLVGRAFVEGNLVPVRVHMEMLFGEVGWYEGASKVSNFEVLLLMWGKASWRVASNGYVAPGAFAVGLTYNGEELYAARGYTNRGFVYGAVDPCNGLICPTDNRGPPLLHFKTYDVFTIWPEFDY